MVAELSFLTFPQFQDISFACIAVFQEWSDREMDELFRLDAP